MAAEDAVLRLLAPGRTRGAAERRVRRHVPARVARCSRRQGSSRTVADLTDVDDCSRATGATAPRWCGSRRPPTPRSRSSTSPRCATLAHARARASSSTTRSRRRTCSGRSSSAPTSSCTPPPSTSAATPTSSAASRSPAIPSSPSASGSCRTRSGAVPSPFDCYLVLRGHQDARGAHGAPLLERAGRRRRCSSTHPAVSRRALPGPRRPPRARGRAGGRCATSAAWCRSSPRWARTPRSQLMAQHAPVHARRVARRRRVADRAPGAHDARVGRRTRRSPSTPRSCACRSASRRIDDLVADLRGALDALS